VRREAPNCKHVATKIQPQTMLFAEEWAEYTGHMQHVIQKNPYESSLKLCNCCN
jgi:hypothetical protein